MLFTKKNTIYSFNIYSLNTYCPIDTVLSMENTAVNKADPNIYLKKKKKKEMKEKTKKKVHIFLTERKHPVFLQILNHTFFPPNHFSPSLLSHSRMFKGIKVKANTKMEMCLEGLA